MAVPWAALEVLGASLCMAVLYEACMWLLFYRGGAWARQLEALERAGKRLEAAQADAAADPTSVAKKKVLQRLDKDVRSQSMALQATRVKIGIATGASMLGGIWLINRRYRGVAVAKMPFAPHRMVANLTHMGLPGDDLTDVSAAFFYVTTTPWLRALMGTLTGSAPGRTAAKFLAQPAADLSKSK